MIIYFHKANTFMQMLLISLEISVDNKWKSSKLSLTLHSSFTVAASGILDFEGNFISHFFTNIVVSFV